MKTKLAANQGWAYESLMAVKGVKIKLPKGQNDLHFVFEHEFATAEGMTVQVPSHYRFGMMIPRGKKGQGCVFLNIHFYNPTEEDCAKGWMVADVEVQRKSRGDQNFVIMDAKRSELQVPCADISYPQGAGEGIQIPGTLSRIVITPRRKSDSAATLVAVNTAINCALAAI